MEGGRANHTWCMGVVMNGHGGLVGGRDGGDGRTTPGGVVHIAGDAGELPECEVKTLITQPSRCLGLGKVEPEFIR